MYRYAPTSTGWPSHYLHDYVAQSQIFEDQLLSLISNGVFNKFPDLKFVLLESGVTWLPGFIWRAVKTWRGVRAEVPWVNRSPADIIRENIRLTIQPFDAPDRNAVERIVEQIDADHMLLFASDYPHWQFEGDAIVPPGLSPTCSEDARRQPAGNLFPPEGDCAMNAPVDILAHSAGDSRLGIIDCDIHPYPKAGALNTYLSERWRKHLAEYGKFNCGPYADRGTYPRFSPNTSPPRCLAAEWRPARLGC